MPKVFIIDTPQANAFATGRDPEHAAVAATTGLLRALSQEELAGVMAQQLAHVKNHDKLIITSAASIAGAIGTLANFTFLFRGGGNCNNPLGVVGAAICGNPLWLASALQKPERGARRIYNHADEANPATAHLFIVNPLHAHAADSLFATHPLTANRVAKLQELASGRLGLELPAHGPSHRRGPWG